MSKKKNKYYNNQKVDEKSQKPDPQLLKDMVMDEALMLAHHKKFSISDLTKYALEYEKIKS